MRGAVGGAHGRGGVGDGHASLLSTVVESVESAGPALDHAHGGDLLQALDRGEAGAQHEPRAAAARRRRTRRSTACDSGSRSAPVSSENPSTYESTEPRDDLAVDRAHPHLGRRAGGAHAEVPEAAGPHVEASGRSSPSPRVPTTPRGRRSSSSCATRRRRIRAARARARSRGARGPSRPAARSSPSPPSRRGAPEGGRDAASHSSAKVSSQRSSSSNRSCSRP